MPTGSTQRYPIVAFGASAGGLEALFEVLSALPSTSTMSFVVIQHLDRDHKSLLAELLAKKTQMPVLEIENGLEVLPGHLYVIPPNTSVTLAMERFRLTPRDHTLTPHYPVDIFFNSLAETRADTAIGVVLSGSNSDGARGLQAIKQGGGITFSQEPASARFQVMPQSAINTGCVDFVLKPVEIAREIARLADHSYLHRSEIAGETQASSSGNLPNDEEDTVKKIFRHLRVAHGVDFSHYKRNTLRRRLARRMALCKVESLREYLAVVEKDPAEVAALYQDFLIRVTGFFRDPESFVGLRTRIFPSICEGRSSKEPIRIWVPGCATGEEVYSIAIGLMEYLGDRVNATTIQIFGTDVSESAIEKARSGIYLDTIEEEVSGERLARFFVKVNSHYRISKNVRDMCIFARHDITRDPPFSRLDLISCRNLLIYLDAPAQRGVMQTFHYALRPHGFLVLGPSESVGVAADNFDLIEKHHRMYTRKAGTIPRTGFEVPQGERRVHDPFRIPVSDELSVFSEIDSVRREADRFLLAQYAPASLLVDAALNILQFRGATSRYLAHASGAASLNLNRVVRPELLIELSPAIQQARDSGLTARREGLRVDDLADVSFEVVPIRAPTNEYCYLILFDNNVSGAGIRPLPPVIIAPLSESEKDRRIVQLKRELTSTREYLQATIEKQETVNQELRSAHEEVLSANEELQSSAEELETAKEELQSSVEELTTTNDELRDRNRELSTLNAELEEARDRADRAQKYAEAIVETVREPLLVLDLDLRVLRANRAFYGDFKTQPAATEGRLLRELESGQWNNPGLAEALDAVLTHNIALDNYEIQFTMHSETRPRTLLINARKIAGNAERAQLILMAVEDVTERDAYEDRLRETDRHKDEFLAMLAHELRNPLAPITHAVHLLQQGDDSTSTSKLYNMIERQTMRLARLVDQLLDVARINRGHVELKRELLDLAAVVRNAADAACSRLEECQHALSLMLPEAPVWVDGDPIRLEQIIANLLENACKYTPRAGRIELQLTQTKTEAVLSIRDNGIGVAAENIEVIFDLFNQVDRSLARSGGGLGIGLTLVRRVLELHGGTIEARSAGSGQGTEFIVHLLLAQVSDKAHQAAMNNNKVFETANVGNRRVLIVDDNVDAAEIMALLLRRWGHQVAVANDGPSALELMRNFQPQHALVDIGLPGMTGYELGEKLRHQFKDLYLVALTGYGQSEDRKTAYAAGFNAHLLKPANPEELQTILANGKTDQSSDQSV